MRIDIERALDELILQEGGIPFQRLAVVLGKRHWRELTACQPKKDLGLDAYAPPSLTPENIGKGLAASITASLPKISADAAKAKASYPDLKALLFVTPRKVTNATQKKWKKEIRKKRGIELHVIEREEIISELTMPENASMRAFHLGFHIDPAPSDSDRIERIRRAAAAATETWAHKITGQPLIDLTAVPLDPEGAEPATVVTLQQLDAELSRSRRVVLEGPAGSGKTTTLIQLAQRARSVRASFVVDLPRWTASGQRMLEFIAGMPQFQAEGVTANDLAGVQGNEPFLFLLNGWNEIAESNSPQAANALQELERDFPNAGIILATRTHHLKPPLPGAMRLRLRGLAGSERSAYLNARLGPQGTDLIARIEADPSLEALTRTPLILSEVASLFHAGRSVPSNKIDILAQVVRMQEQRAEHTVALAGAPIFGRQAEYLTVLANMMTSSGSVELSEARARAIIDELSTKLASHGQVEPAGAPTVLATLTAHHLLERIDYPDPAYRFHHQQFQEYFSALHFRGQLLELREDDSNAIPQFTAEYVNLPEWREPLRMTAASLAEETGDARVDTRNARAGATLVQMALTVDLVFAGELARLCGASVWDEVRTEVGGRFRSVHAMGDGNFQHYAVAAMLATGMGDFRDIIVPLLSSSDRQSRLRTYGLWPDFRVTSLGLNWRDELDRWSDGAQADFVSELLRHRIDSDVVAFAIQSRRFAVKTGAVEGLMWHKGDDALTRILRSMDEENLEYVVREYAGRLPSCFTSQSIGALRKSIDTMANQSARLRTALRLVELGGTDVDGVIMEAMDDLPDRELRDLALSCVDPALKYLRDNNPAWVNDWVATKVVKGVLDGEEHWMRFATVMPDELVEECLKRLETERLEYRHRKGTMAVVAAFANAKLAARVFSRLRRLRRPVSAKPDEPHESERLVIRQLESLFRRFPSDVAAAGIVSSVRQGSALDIKVASRILSGVGMSDEQRLHIADDELRGRLREVLKEGVDTVLGLEDFTGVEKSHLASAISEVGRSEDMADLLTLIHADLERVRQGRSEWVAGRRGMLADGARVSYARWHVAAVMRLDPVGAADVLIRLLPEPEYAEAVGRAMARDWVRKPARFGGTGVRSDLMWVVRQRAGLEAEDDRRRRRFATALRSEIVRLGGSGGDWVAETNRKELARALAAIDGRDSASLLFDVIAMPGEWNHHIGLDTAERLVMAGSVIPAEPVFALADSVLARIGDWPGESNRYLLHRMVALCAFVDDSAAGIAKAREILGMHPLMGHELRDVVAALGERRSSAGAGLLYAFASDQSILEQLGPDLINAIGKLDTSRSRDMLMSFVDPDLAGLKLTRGAGVERALIGNLTQLGHRHPGVAMRLRELCHRPLPDRNRTVLSRVMASIGTAEAHAANLSLLDDARPVSIPRGIWEQLKAEFVERRPTARNTNAFDIHARTSNALRAQLFRMSRHDPKRRESALELLGAIEVWRLKYGRPEDEPRHPDLTSGAPWPPKEPS